MSQSTTTRLIELRTGAIQAIPDTGGEINATATSNATDTPAVADYTTPGVSGVTGGIDVNLGAVNDAVNAEAAGETSTQTTMTRQGLVDEVVALTKIIFYENGGSVSALHEPLLRNMANPDTMQSEY